MCAEVPNERKFRVDLSSDSSPSWIIAATIIRMEIARYTSPRRIKRKVKSTLVQTEAVKVAKADPALNVPVGERLFSRGTRPVIRWIKADGLDDIVTRAAIGAATRIFGSEVDYCLCTRDISVSRARRVLEWADQPVELWPIDADDNVRLANRLQSSGCAPESFGYWWKWFPERVRPGAPEWILDGDMVITARPDWFDAWASGGDVCRISGNDGRSNTELYGRYADIVSNDKQMYSGLISLPPDLHYMDAMERVLDEHPLAVPHHGILEMDEQGVVALSFDQLGAESFPVCEFPFGRAFEDDLDFGDFGDLGRAWGYHFGHAFRGHNKHFAALTADGTIYSQSDPSLEQRFTWLRNGGQWGVPGWSLDGESLTFILDTAASYAGRNVLEIGTSRGRIAAMLSSLGCVVTTVDHADRGAKVNLDAMNVDVVVADGREFLRHCEDTFDLIVVDLHDNSPKLWKSMFPELRRVLKPGGSIVINNAFLWKIPRWSDETGVRWLLRNLPEDFVRDSKCTADAGVVVLRNV